MQGNPGQAAGGAPVPPVDTSAGYRAEKPKRPRSNGWTETDSRLFVECCEWKYGRFPSVSVPLLHALRSFRARDPLGVLTRSVDSAGCERVGAVHRGVQLVHQAQSSWQRRADQQLGHTAEQHLQVSLGQGEARGSNREQPAGGVDSALLEAAPGVEGALSGFRVEGPAEILRDPAKYPPWAQLAADAAWR